jgi:hypothetical protein
MEKALPQCNKDTCLQHNPLIRPFFCNKQARLLQDDMRTLQYDAFHAALCTLYAELVLLRPQSFLSAVAAVTLNCRRDPFHRGNQPEQPRN